MPEHWQLHGLYETVAPKVSSRQVSPRQVSPWQNRRNSAGIRRSQLVAEQPTWEQLDVNYCTIKSLGAGSFGTITLVKDQWSGVLRVCKRVHTAGMHTPLLEMMRKEIVALRTLDHPYIIKLYEFSEDFLNQQIVLILEYADGGDALTLLRNSNGVPLRDGLVARLLHQLLSALAYCHARGIAHRDVKPDNMMLTRPFSGEDPNCKVIDFGLAEFAKSPMTEFCGTPPYMAPEILSGAPYTFYADVWSVGCTAMELLTGTPPFGSLESNMNNMHIIFASIRAYHEFANLEPLLSQTCGWTCRDDEVRSFVQNCLVLKAESRPTAKLAASHAWMDRHRVLCCLTEHMVDSMTLYAAASPVIRCCLLIVASQIDEFEAQQIAPAFVCMDTDGDGLINIEEFCAAVAAVSGCCGRNMNAKFVFENIDADHSGSIFFTEFVAACLYGSYESLHEILFECFGVLDKDRDGWFTLEEVLPSFNQRSRMLLSCLPADKPISSGEWCRKLGSISQDGLLGGSAFLPASTGLLSGCCSVEQRRNVKSFLDATCEDSTTIEYEASRTISYAYPIAGMTNASR